jgi:hypothetical protein
VERNTETTHAGASDTAQKLDILAVPGRRGPRFVGLPMSREDQITLLIFSEALAEQHQLLLERCAGRPIGCEIVAEIRGIIARAEFAAKVEVMQVLAGIEEAAA